MRFRLLSLSSSRWSFRQDVDEGERWLAREIGGYVGEVTDAVDLTVAGLLDEWLETSRHDLSPTTLRTYRRMIPIISAAIGHHRVTKLTPRIMERWIADLHDQGLVGANGRLTYVHRAVAGVTYRSVGEITAAIGASRSLLVYLGPDTGTSTDIDQRAVQEESQSLDENIRLVTACAMRIPAEFRTYRGAWSHRRRRRSVIPHHQLGGGIAIIDDRLDSPEGDRTEASSLTKSGGMDSGSDRSRQHLRGHVRHLVISERLDQKDHFGVDPVVRVRR
ncbi:MAG: hypothetical protein FJW98_08895, partial [Actinobacteria bacterium]|nr:hypothetical protein [Actinomycetota bacterium]